MTLIPTGFHCNYNQMWAALIKLVLLWQQVLQHFLLPSSLLKMPFLCDSRKEKWDLQHRRWHNKMWEDFLIARLLQLILVNIIYSRRFLWFTSYFLPNCVWPLSCCNLWAILLRSISDPFLTPQPTSQSWTDTSQTPDPQLQQTCLGHLFHQQGSLESDEIQLNGTLPNPGWRNKQLCVALFDKPPQLGGEQLWFGPRPSSP